MQIILDQEGQNEEVPPRITRTEMITWEECPMPTLNLNGHMTNLKKSNSSNSNNSNNRIIIIVAGSSSSISKIAMGVATIKEANLITIVVEA